MIDIQEEFLRLGVEIQDCTPETGLWYDEIIYPMDLSRLVQKGVLDKDSLYRLCNDPKEPVNIGIENLQDKTLQRIIRNVSVNVNRNGYTLCNSVNLINVDLVLERKGFIMEITCKIVK